MQTKIESVNMTSDLNVKSIINGTKMIIEALMNVITELGFNDE